MKKIALTGHTSGVGKNILENIQGEFRCYSRSNGFDINKPEIRKKIILNASDCDIFINNAKGEGLSQLNLLFDLFTAWKDQDKHIINIGSRAAVACEYRFKPHLYSIEKAALHEGVKQILNCPRKCKITNIAFGLLNTPSNSSEDQKKMNLSVVHETLSLVLNSSLPINYIQLW